MNKPRISIDIVSDVVCPWCYIGKRRLEQALVQLSDEFEFTVNYLPFELNPHMPKEGKPQKKYLIEKFGGEARYEQLTDHVSQIAAAEGLAFNYKKQTTSPNTLDAHRVIWLAKQFNKQAEVKEALMKAYFEEGIDLSVKENLITVAVAAGMERKPLVELLDSEAGTTEVKFEEQLNSQRGISGVPFYIINQKYGLSGAQPADVFVKTLSQIGDAMNLQGETCGPDKNC